MSRTKSAFDLNARAARARAKLRFPGALRVLVGFLLVFLQLAGALHFALVRHTFSAALGGVVHVHGATEPTAAASPAKRRLASREFTNASASCIVDVCPYADAPQSSPAETASAISSSATFGEPSLLGAAEAQSARVQRVFLNAPKTSPPA